MVTVSCHGTIITCKEIVKKKKCSTDEAGESRQGRKDRRGKNNRESTDSNVCS